jgi:single-strand DNA-binding protein
VGHIYTSEYEDRDGIRRSTLEMRATSVGPDLSRCHARIEKTVSSGSDAAHGPASEPGSAADTAGTDDADRANSADAAAA